MKHLQKFNESLEDNIYSEIQQMVDANQFLKGKVTATKESVFEAGDFILLLDDLTHITESHWDATVSNILHITNIVKNSQKNNI